MDQIDGQVYRIRIGPDYTRKILDWIRIAKISKLFNTSKYSVSSEIFDLTPCTHAQSNTVRTKYADETDY